MNTQKKYVKYAFSIKFNCITREVTPEIPIKSYKNQFREHMIRNGIWDVFSLPDPCNKDKKWDLILHKYQFPLEYTKNHVKILHKGYKAGHYVVQNLTW